MDYKNKSIVLDLDGVIADIDTGISDYLQYVCGVDVDYKDWLMTDTQDEEALKLFSNALFWKNLKPFEDAVQAEEILFTKGADGLPSQADAVLANPERYANKFYDVNKVVEMAKEAKKGLTPGMKTESRFLDTMENI